MVYVDDASITSDEDQLVISHMIADTHEELIAMARRTGVPSEWIRRRGTAYEYFDVSKRMRLRAIVDGAKEITRHDAALICWKRRYCNAKQG